MNSKKLVQLKKLLNKLAPIINRVVPKVEPKTSVGIFLDEVFDEMMKNVKKDPKRLFKDKNFPSLLSAFKRAFLFVAESDGAYRNHLFYLFQVVAKKYLKWYSVFYQVWEEWYEKNAYRFRHFDKNSNIHRELLFCLYITQAEGKFDFSHIDVESL